MGILLTVFLLGSFFLYFYRKFKLENDELKEEKEGLFEIKEEMRLSLLSGVYHRYKKEEDPEKEENPLLFERFVARILNVYYDGETYVTRGSGDYGVDIELECPEGLFLVQVKCYAPNHPIGFEPIAIIHSQMEKQKAVGGLIVTTSRFTPNAVKYADELNIELIDGLKLIDMWIVGSETRYKFKEEANEENQKVNV